jgi:hypothetical protein
MAYLDQPAGATRVLVRHGHRNDLFAHEKAGAIVELKEHRFAVGAWIDSELAGHAAGQAVWVHVHLEALVN